MSCARALFASPAARRALVDGRAGAIEFKLSRGAYVRLGDGWLWLGGVGEPFGPLSMAVDGLEQLKLRPQWPAYVTERRLLIGDHVVSLERMQQRRTLPLGVTVAAATGAAADAAATALAALPTPPSALRPGIGALVDGRTRDGVRVLAGRGEGLTPAGDDVLAGYAAARTALGTQNPPESAAPDDGAPLSALAAERSSPLGLAYLRCAERGELPDAAAQLLRAISRGSVPAVKAALPSLRAWGASSGTALAWGMGTHLGRSRPEANPAGARSRPSTHGQPLEPIPRATT